MQMVNDQALDQCRKRADEVIARRRLQHGIDDALMVPHAIVVLIGMRVQQLVDDVRIVVRDGLAYLGARIATRKRPGHGKQLIEHRLVPPACIQMLAADEGDLLARVIDERAQVALLLLIERVAENLVHMFAHHARAVVKDVHERIVFAVQIAHEMLGTLGEIENGLEIDDLGEDRLLRGELLGQKTQVFQGLFAAIVHADTLLAALVRRSS